MQYTKQYTNLASYKFTRLENLEMFRDQFRAHCNAMDLKGTILLAPEGVNLFVAGTAEAIARLRNRLCEAFGPARWDFKESFSDHQPFKRMLVKIKKEIITFGVPSVSPADKTGKRVTPLELQSWIREGKDFVFLDTRNDYEVRIGTFHGAIDPKLKTFRQFPDVARKLLPDLKDKTVVTFCTGGIRCEKATALMNDLGYKDVYQLDGGILKYFDQAQGEGYDGECFVFDYRVGLDHALNETDTVLCYNCQQPVTHEEQAQRSYVEGVSCPHCFEQPKEHKEQIARELISRGQFDTNEAFTRQKGASL